MSLQKYECGDVIVPFCDAFFKFLDWPHWNTRCKTCFRLLPFDHVRCNNCCYVRYCNERCRQQDWKNGHFRECHSAAFRSAVVSCDGLIKLIVLRLYALIRSNPELISKPYVMYDGTTRCFKDLVTNVESWRTNPLVLLFTEEIVRPLMYEDIVVNREDFIHLQAVFMSNALRICDRGVLLGHGIFMECTCFDHSCRPSANCFSVDGRLQIRAMVDIEVGTAPTISYVDLSEHHTTQGRKNALMTMYSFHCQCQKCVLETQMPFDYEDLKSRIQMLNAMTHGNGASIASFWSRIEIIHSELDTSFRTLFNEHDVVVIRHLVKFAHLLAQMNVQTEKAEWFIHMVAGAVAKTAGKDSEMFSDLLADDMLKSRLYELKRSSRGICGALTKLNGDD